MNIYNTIQTRLDRGQGSTLLSHYTPQGIRRTLLEETPPEPGLSFTQEGDILTLNEVYLPQPRLVILGGGHVALPLCHFAARLGFDVWVYDDRPSFANPTRFPDAHTVICDDFAHMSHRLGLRRTDYVTVLTRGHRHDISCLTTILQGDEVPHYLGMIGSKRRIAIVKEEVSAAIGHTERLDALYAPIGLSIGSVTPEEIALSILAEIVQVKRLAPDGRKRTQEDTVDRDLLHWLSAPDRPPAALVTIVSTTGSTPRETGAKMAVTATGQTIGSIGGGCAEADAIRRARDILDEGGHTLLTVDLADTAEEEGMVCGGTLVVLIEAL